MFALRLAPSVHCPPLPPRIGSFCTRFYVPAVSPFYIWDVEWVERRARRSSKMMSGFATVEQSGLSDRPHIIYHLADDLGHFNVGFSNNPEARTPNLDALVAAGVKLDHHYAFKYCSPTRSSLLSGRLPLHVNTANRKAAEAGGIDMRMTTIAAKLKAVGYSTFHVGKWHAGAHASGQLPVHVGFDGSLGYLGGAEGHYNQREGNDGLLSEPVDLFLDGAPAYGRNGTYGAFLYSAYVARVIRAHDPAKPLFVFMAWQEAHVPNEVPDEFTDGTIDFPLRRTYEGMVHCLDSGVGNVTAALKAKGMYNHTLIVFSADNGGPIHHGVHAFGANNFPLRGQKFSDFEGGTRVVAFVSGGFLPRAVRGTTHTDGPMHICDWYATFCALAGCDPSDDADGVPPPDSLNLWGALSARGVPSPRTAVPLSDSAHVRWPYKLVLGRQGGLGFWTGRLQPNGTALVDDDPGCPDLGCLFDLLADPGEHHDLAPTMPKLRAKLTAELHAVLATAFQTGDNCCPGFTKCTTQDAYVAAHQGFLGPVCEKP